MSSIQFSPIADSPFPQFPQPPNASLSPTQLRVLSTLFFIEDDFVNGLLSLASMIKDKPGISLSQFEHNLSGLGSALKNVSDFDENVNGLFSLFDQLVRKQTPAPQARLSSLTLKSQVDGKDVTKVFLSGAAPIVAPAPAVTATPIAPKTRAAGAPGAGG